MPGMICVCSKDKVFYKGTYAWVWFCLDSSSSQILILVGRYLLCVRVATRELRLNEAAKLREIKSINKNQKQIYFTVQK